MAGEPTFTPVVNPIFSLTDDHDPKIRMLKFGDGYIARVKDGINNDPEKMTLKWENLTQAEYTSIWAFITARGGDQAFLWTAPWLSSGNTQRKYVFTRYKREKKDANAYDIDATIEQVFEA